MDFHLISSLQWRHNEHSIVSNHQPNDCLLNCLFRRRSRKTLKLRVTGLCAGNSPGTGEFPTQMASNAENYSFWWRHHVTRCIYVYNGLPYKDVMNMSIYNLTFTLYFVLYIYMNNTATSWHQLCFVINIFRPRQNGCHFADDVSNAFSWMKMCEFCLRFHWSLFLRVQLTIFHHWFR